MLIWCFVLHTIFYTISPIPRGSKVVVALQVMCSNLTAYLFTQFIKPTYKSKRGWLRLFAYRPVCFSHMWVWGPHMREGVKENDKHCLPKSYQLKVFRKFVCLTIILLVRACTPNKTSRITEPNRLLEYPRFRMIDEEKLVFSERYL